MKQRYNRYKKSTSTVSLVLAFLAKDYTHYGLSATVQDEAVTQRYCENPQVASRKLIDNSTECVAARENLIKRIKRRALKNGQMYVIVTTNTVRGRARDYLVKRGEAKLNLAWINVTKSDDGTPAKVSCLNEHQQVSNSPSPDQHEREIELRELAKKSGLNKTQTSKTIKALRFWDEQKPYERFNSCSFRIPVKIWGQIPNFNRLKLVNKIECDCVPDSENRYNPECPLCSHRALEEMIDCLDEFIENPEYHFDRDEDEIKALDGKYKLFDLMGYENHSGDFGACWDCIAGTWHDSMYDIIYRVESCLNGGPGVSLQNLKDYRDKLKTCLPMSERGLQRFRLDEVIHLQSDTPVYQK